MSELPRDDVPVDPDAPRRQRPLRDMPWDVLLVIAAGGAVGGAMRHGVGTLVPTGGAGFAWGTFIENVSGSLLLAILVVYLVEVWPPSRYARPFLGVGVLGGFTTFSAYTNEARDLLLDGQVPTALVYVAATVLGCLLATWTGLRLARRATRPGRR